MDATQLFSKKSAIFLSFVLLAVAPWHAQAAVTLQPSQPTITLTSVGSSAVTVTASDGNSYNFTASVTYAAGDLAWLAVPATNISVCTGAGATYNTTTANSLTFAVGCQAGSLSPGLHTATVTLAGTGLTSATITVYYTTGGSGGTGALTATPASLSLCANPGFTTVGYVNLSTTSTSAISYSTPAYPVSWLTVGPTSGTVVSGVNQTLTFQASAVGFSAGFSSSQQVTVSYNGVALNIPITFTVGGSCTSTAISVTPNISSIAYTTGGAAQSAGPFFVTTPAVLYNASTTAGSWLSLMANGVTNASISGINVSTPFYVVTNGNLPQTTGGYSNTVTITDGNGNTTYLTVNLSVNGGSTGITVAPNPITLSAAYGQSGYVQTTVTVTSSITGTVTAYVSGTGLAYDTVNNPSVTAGGQTTITIYANAAGLGQNTYPGNLYVTVSGTTTLGPQAFPVSFQVGSTTTGSVASGAAPSSLQFNYETTQATPPAQSIMIGGTSTYSISTSVTSGANWLSVTPTSGTAPAQVAVSVAPSGLATGTYSGTVTVNFGDGTVQYVNVNMTVVSGSPRIYANPGTVIFNQQGTSPTSSVYLYSTDGSTIPVTVAASSSWLSFISAVPTSTQTSFAVQANTTGLPNGLTTGSITVTYNTSMLTIPVVVYINNGTGNGSGYLTFSPSSLSFSAQGGSTTTPAQTLYVGATTSTYFSAAVAAQNCNGNWLSISYTPTTVYSGYTQPVQVTANPTGLAAETCSGTIQFSANGLTQTVGVTLTITGGNLTPSPTSLAFSYSGTGAAPAAQAITLTNTSASAISYTAVATVTTPSGGTWLTFTSNSGTSVSGSVINGAPGSLSMSVNPAGLPTGTYNGTVTVTPSGGTAQTVAVTFTVTATPISASPTSLSFTYQAGGTAPPAQSVSVTGGGFTATAASTGSWLAVTPASGTAAASLSVTVSPASLTAGTYTGTVTVSGANGATGTVTINVTLTVTAPLPTITALVNAASFAAGAVSPGEIISIGGTGLGPATPATLTVDSNGNVSTSLGGVTVTIGGTPAPLVYVSNIQINVIVPYQVSGLISPSVVVTYLGQSSNGYPLQSVVAAPGLFTQSSSGSGPGAILNQDYTLNGTAHPAAKGSIVQVFMTGEGQTSPAGVTGKVNNVTNASQLPVPLLPVSALVGGQPALVKFAGEAPGFVSGVMQVNVLIPATAASGAQSIVISVGTNASQNGVTVTVQ